MDFTVVCYVTEITAFKTVHDFVMILKGFSKKASVKFLVL